MAHLDICLSAYTDVIIKEIFKKINPLPTGSKTPSATGTTAMTNVLAIVISESNGNIRIFSGGKTFIEIEKAPRKGAA